MAANNDLFAGFEINGKVIAPESPVQSVTSSGDIVDNSDILAGFEVVESVISEITPDTGKAGTFEFFTGAQRKQQTPELAELPEFKQTEAGNTFAIAAGLLSTFDPKAQIEIIRDQVPEAKFETTPDGSTIIEVVGDDGVSRRSVLNRPGLSPQDVTTGIAQVLAFIPSARLAVIGKTIAKKIGLGAFGAGATEQVLQEGGITLGREKRDPVSTGIATVTGGLAEAVVPAVQAIRSSRQAARIGAGVDELAQVKGSVDIAQEAAEETGIPLFQAQQTGVPAQLEKQSFVAQLPAGARSSIEGLKAQNKAAGNAVETFIESIAPPEAVITGAENFRTAASRSVAAVKRARSEAASPIYKQAFRRQRKGQNGLIDTKALETKLSQMIKQFEPNGQIAKNLVLAQAKIKNAKGNLQKLHLAKTEIDQTINSFGADSVGNTTKRFLTGIKNDLTDDLVNQSPSYRAAIEEFTRLSPDVSKIQDSIIGKIAALDDTQLKQISGKIFDPAQTNPKIILDAKRAIKDVDPSAWDEMIRVELERRLGSIKSTAEAGTVENIPGQLFRALFPNDKSSKVLFNALDGDAKKNLKFLQVALGRARLGRPGGSQTAAREEIRSELRGGAIQSVRSFFKGPISTLASSGEDAAFNRRAAALSKALFDPTWKAEMKALRKLSPDSPAAARAMTQLLNDIESTEKEQ